MNVCHILLGHPWQHDLQTLHRGRDNTYKFNWMRHKVILLPSKGENVTKKNVEETPNKQLFPIIHKEPFISKEDMEVWALIVDGQENSV